MEDLTRHGTRDGWAEAIPGLTVEGYRPTSEFAEFVWAPITPGIYRVSSIDGAMRFERLEPVLLLDQKEPIYWPELGLCLLPGEHSVIYDDPDRRPYIFTKSEWAIVDALLKNLGHTCPTEFLIEHMARAHDDENYFLDTQGIRVHVSRMRRSLLPVSTVYSYGYRLESPGNGLKVQTRASSTSTTKEATI